MYCEDAMNACAAHPAVELSYPFGEDTPVFKVAGKIFAALSDEVGAGRITLKCDPEDARALVEMYPEVTPGYHMNKRHWITLALPAHDAPAEQLIQASYDLVVAGLPRAQRPTP